MADEIGVEVMFNPLLMIPRQLEKEWVPVPDSGPLRSVGADSSDHLELSPKSESAEPAALSGRLESGAEPEPPSELSCRRVALCLCVWERPYIHSDGTVLPCCKAGSRDSLGNILRQPISEIWNSPLVVAMRRYLKSGIKSQLPIPCYDCPINASDRSTERDAPPIL
jgi:radical SAM protein with 4Fe4S-binding SPASM domain